MSDPDLYPFETNAHPNFGAGFRAAILGIAMNIIATSLITAFVCSIVFLVVGRGTIPSVNFEIGIICGLFSGIPGGMLLSFVVPLFSNRCRITVILVGAVIWAITLSLFLVQGISSMSLATNTPIKRFNPTCAAVGFGVKATVTRAAHAG